MTYEDIVALAKAGFSAEQIARLSAVQNTAQPQPQPNPVPQPQPNPVPQPLPNPVPQPQPNPVPQPQPNPVPYNSPDYILQAINSVNDTMRQMQINMSNQPKQETTEDIIASIINPPLPSKEGNK